MKKSYNLFSFKFILFIVFIFIFSFIFYIHFFIINTFEGQFQEFCIKNKYLFKADFEKQGFFYPKITVKNISIFSEEHDDWHWEAKKIEFSFSFFRLFTYWNIPIVITIEKLDCYSVIKNQNSLAIFDFFSLIENSEEQFFKPNIDAIYIQNGKIFIDSKQFHIGCILFFHSRIEQIQSDSVEIITTIIDGDLKKAGSTRPFVASISGISQYIQIKQDNKLSVQLKSLFTESKEVFYLKGTFENGTGRFSLLTNHPSCFLDPIIYTNHNSKVSGQLSLSFLQKIVQETEFLNGSLAINLTFDHTKNNFLRGQIALENCNWGTKKLCSSAKIQVSSKGSVLSGPITIKTTIGDFFGNYSYNISTQIGECCLKNKQNGKSLLFPFISLLNNTFDFNCNLYKEYCTVKIAGDIIDTLKHKTYKNNMTLMGTYNEGMQIQAETDTKKLIAYILWGKKYQGGFSLYDSETKVASGTVQENDSKEYNFFGYAQTNLIKTITEFFFQAVPFYGNGVLNVCGTKNKNIITAEYKIQGGAIDIPFVHNFILSLDGIFTVDTEKKKIIVPKMYTKFSTGSMVCANVKLSYDDMWAIETCKIPIKITKMAISPHNFFDSLISTEARILKKTSKDQFLITGIVTIHDGFLKNDEPFKNLFLGQQSFPFKSSFKVEHAIEFETKNPISIETNEIKTSIGLKITSTGQITAPRFQGYITCQNGEILFPYKPLYITHGKVIFSGGSFQDATIELFARNIVKNYKITMRTSGSLAEHAIFFDSSPSLSQAQISSLLFFGSLQENISIFMPSLFSHTIKLGSLNIHFVPGFVDKSSRGGIRGALEIAVNNRLRATIQKNFTLSEDTRFELEYAITDNISLRAVRDERRDLGGELEFRWKF